MNDTYTLIACLQEERGMRDRLQWKIEGVFQAKHVQLRVMRAIRSKRLIMTKNINTGSGKF